MNDKEYKVKEGKVIQVKTSIEERVLSIENIDDKLSMLQSEVDHWNELRNNVLDAIENNIVV